jgi:DNA-directed RNA polymerase subunit beta
MSNQIVKASTYMLPDLVEIQRSSFRWFLEEGLIEELDSFSPITDYTGKLELRFLGKDYKLRGANVCTHPVDQQRNP